MRERADIDSADPIDSRLGSVAAAPRGPWVWHRHALGLAASPVPSFAALLVGLMLGPQALGVLTPGVLLAVAPATVTATVALGVLIGLDLARDRNARPGLARLAAGAAVEGGVTLLAVTAALAAVAFVPAWRWLGASYMPVLLGVAAASSAMRMRGSDDEHTLGRLGDLDDLLPVVTGALLLAWVGGRSTAHSAALFGLTLALSAAIAAAAALLVTGSDNEGERRVYAAGAVLLLAGLAASLAASTVFVGALAAWVWNQSSESARTSLARDVRYLQHPIVVLVLVIAGAEAVTSGPVIAAAGVFAVVRVVGKSAGGALAARLVPGAGRWLGLRLIAPGAAGLAGVLMVVHGTSLASVSDPLLGIAVWGAVLSDLLAALVLPPESTT